MGSHVLSDNELKQFSKFVRKHVGLYFSPKKYDDLRRGIALISSERGFSDLSACLEWILSSNPDQSLIEMLAASLTVGESYFFREPDVFSQIEQNVLPAIISRRRKQGRFLRIWSAGCSTGEEAYSLAILLSKIIPDISTWSITILATDINPNALKKAEAGIYSGWSFRSPSHSVQDLYFQKLSDDRYMILDTIKKLVIFSYLNLVEDYYPALLTNTNAMDIVFCRNVLMYFSKETILTTIEKLQRSLVSDGRLITSMTETMLIQNQHLTPDVINKITMFRKVDIPNSRMITAIPVMNEVPFSSEIPKSVLISPLTTGDRNRNLKKPCTIPDPVILPKPETRGSTDISDETEKNEYNSAVRLFESGDYKGAEKILDSIIIHNPSDHRAMALMAQVLADQGDIDGAQTWCERAVYLDKLNPSYYHLLATILQEEGEVYAAIGVLRRALYADPSFIPAHFTLAHIKRHLGKTKESDIHFKNARELLCRFEPEDIIGGTGGMSAGYLERNINAIMGEDGVS